jgi:hypothetical protein
VHDFHLITITGIGSIGGLFIIAGLFILCGIIALILGAGGSSKQQRNIRIEGDLSPHRAGFALDSTHPLDPETMSYVATEARRDRAVGILARQAFGAPTAEERQSYTEAAVVIALAPTAELGVWATEALHDLTPQRQIGYGRAQQLPR